MATPLAPPLEIAPLGPAGGSEITGIDIARLDEDGFRAIRNALSNTGVVVVRDQDISPEQHIVFARRFGGIDLNNYFPIDSAYPEIALVRKEKDQTTNIGGGWHTDHSYDAVPAMGSVLVARELPPSGGDTLFIDMAAVFASLPGQLKDELRALGAVHSADHIYGESGYYASTDQGGSLRGQAISAGAVHPAVIRHPDSGREVLYVNPAFTLRFEGMTREESLPLLGRLYAAATRPENVIRVRWRPGTVIIWDNRSTWHTAENDYQGHARTMHRITLTGVALS
ncbi:TauD/TfdA family dioxygenase [Sphingomonas gilva]|uniref:TauD/TfdA family dioxygenase n=1 Tax=Sphingomonas gilva TaxID=2305907 RepID=A0A396RRG6_9SPHN|nr:TauD/TfdA family dioxygenase [Sphingomonas gilva]RHW19120.1 TauD/TfdA family dioxygenase [Sphingomonas gilva]